MTRRLVFVVLLAVVLVAGVFTTAWGQQRIRLIVNGAEVYPEVPPQIIGGRTMVPLRAVAEALGANVSWDERSFSVVVNHAKAPAETGLTKYDYLAMWDSLYGRLTAISNEVKNNLEDIATSIRPVPQSVTDQSLRFEVSKTLNSYSSQVENLFDALAGVTPPADAATLHRETLKEMVLLATFLKVSGEYLLNPPIDINAINPLGKEVYAQHAKVSALRKAIQ